ncbi:MAG: hypothetical protein H0X29_05295 [Parachlamydiaceae bacterium]|nr:hypothetical protein [Parachlamydiaceae bacterium]
MSSITNKFIPKIKEWLNGEIEKQLVNLTPQKKCNIAALICLTLNTGEIIYRHFYCRNFKPISYSEICNQNTNIIVKSFILKSLIPSALMFNMLRIMKLPKTLIIHASCRNTDQKKGIALYLTAKDPNFLDINLSVPYELSKDFRIEKANIGNVCDIAIAIEEVSQSKLPIKVLVIAGHGCSQGIQLNKNETILGYEDELRAAFNKLDPKGIIVLNSCSSANGKLKDMTCVAERIAELSNNRKIFAAHNNIHYHFLKSGLTFKSTAKDAELPIAVYFRDFNMFTKLFDKDMTVVFEKEPVSFEDQLARDFK